MEMVGQDGETYVIRRFISSHKVRFRWAKKHVDSVET